LASIRSRIENLQSPVGCVTPILTQRALVLPEDEIQDENDHNHEENTADMEAEQSTSLGDNLSNVLGGYPNMPEPTTQSKIASMRKILE
jgi:hypothetical protein